MSSEGRIRRGETSAYNHHVDWLIFGGIAVVLIALGFVAQHFGWIDLSNKSKTSGSRGGSGVFGIGDEVFNPSKYEAALEMDRQTVLPAPAPLPGDGDKGIYDGNVRIDLTEINRELEDTAPKGRHRP